MGKRTSTRFSASKRMPLAQPVAKTPLAKRMLTTMGEDDFRLVRTLQQTFGAKVLHYQDDAGQVGTRPSWATDEDTP
jgi:hypothetical protein